MNDARKRGPAGNELSDDIANCLESRILVNGDKLGTALSHLRSIETATKGKQAGYKETVMEHTYAAYDIISEVMNNLIGRRL